MTSENRDFDDVVANHDSTHRPSHIPLDDRSTMAKDSASSMVANVVGLLTFAFLVIAAMRLRLDYIAGYQQDHMKSQQLLNW